MKKIISVTLVLLIVISAGMVSAFADGPYTITYGADLLNVTKTTAGFKYTFDGASSPSGSFDTTTGEINVSGHATVKIETTVGDESGSEYTVEISRDAAPSADLFTITATSSNDGKISWTSDLANVQYKKSGDADWTTVSSGSKVITGLAAGEYYIREWKSGQLASCAVKLTVPSATSYDIWIGGEEISSAYTSKAGVWSYDNSTKTLTLSSGAAIIGSHEGAGLYIGSSSELTTIKLLGNATITSNGTAAGTGTEKYSYGIHSSKAITITGTGVLTVSPKETATADTVDASDAVVLEGCDLTIENGVSLYAYGKNAEKSSQGIFCNNLINKGLIIAYSEKASDKSNAINVNGTITNSANAKITATATSIATSACGINSTGKITNAGEIYASSVVPADAGTSLPGTSTAIAASEIESSGILEAYACPGTTDSIGISGNVTVTGNTLKVSNGAGGTSLALNGSLTVNTPTGTTYTSVTIEGPKGAVKDGSVLYGASFSPVAVVKAGADETSAAVVTTPTTDTYKSCYLNITNEDAPTVTAITLSPTTLNLYLDSTTEGTLTPTVTMSDGSTYGGDIEWTTSDSTVAGFKSDSDSTIVAKKVGQATITAKAGDKTATATVTVAAAKSATGVSIDTAKLGLKAGNSSTVTATLVPSGSTGTINWSTYSGNSTIVKIEVDSTNPNKCKITGVKNGEEIVVASLSGTTAKAYCTVTVSNSGTAYKISPYYGAWYYDKTDGYTFTLNTTNTVSKVTINGTVMSIVTANGSNGYQTVTIPYSSMSKLSIGYSQPLVVTFTDSTYVTGKVAVISTKDAPPTGDISYTPYVIMTAVSALGAMGAVTVLKKKEK